MAGSCNAASGSLVDVDIPELSESPYGLVLRFSVPTWDLAADSEGIRPETDIGNV